MLRRFCIAAFMALSVTYSLASAQDGVPALSVTAPNGQPNILIGSVHVGISGLRVPSATIFTGARRYVVEHTGPGQSSSIQMTNSQHLAPWAQGLTKREIDIYLQRAQCSVIDKNAALALLRFPTVQYANQLAYTICDQPRTPSRDDLLAQMRPPSVPVDVLEDEDSVEEKRRRGSEKLGPAGFRWILAHDPKVVLQGIKDALNEGDYDAIQTQFKESLADPSLEEEFARVMIETRNVEWMPRLKRYLDDGRAVILVGAMHLPGPNGLISLLRTAGYQVSPIPLPVNAPSPKNTSKLFNWQQ